MTRRPHRAYATVAILLVALSAGLGGCAPFTGTQEGRPAASRDAAGQPHGPLSTAEVSTHPEAHLYYPGSTLVSHFGGGQYHHPLSGDDDAAFAGGVLAPRAAPAAIYLWYQRWALKHGWRSYDFPPLSTQKSTEGFERGQREIFIVAIDDPHILGETTGRRIPRGGTVYEIRYEIIPHGQTVPS